MKLTRRDTVTMALAATAAAGIAALPGMSFAADGDHVDLVKLMAPAGVPDRPIGDPNAKVTVIEYASPTCIHCAVFSNTVLGPFIETYVDTGKVQLIVRPFARNNVDVLVFMLAEHAARAAEAAAATAPAATDPSAPSAETSSEPAAPVASDAGGRAFEAVLSAFFRSRDSWIESSDPLAAMKAVALQFGFTDTAFETARTDIEYARLLAPMQQQAVNEFGLTGTPTFYINGRQTTGEASLEALAAQIDPLL